MLAKWWNYYSLIYSEADSIAISEAQIVFCMCFAYFLCNIVRSKGETEKEKLCYRNINVYNYFGIEIDVLVRIDIAYLKKGF